MNDPYGLIASGIPPEMVEQMMGLQRKEAIAKAMMQQAMGPLEEPNARGAIPGRIMPASILAKLAQGYFASQGMKGVDAERGEFSASAQKRIADAMMQYEQDRSGQPAIPMPADELGGGPGKPATPGDPRAAIARAMTNPMLAKNPIVNADLAALRKSAEPYTLTPGAQRIGPDGKPVASAPFRPQEHVINGKLYVTGPDGTLTEKGGPGPAPDPNKPFMPDGSPNNAYQEYEKGKALAGATRVQTNVNAFTPASEQAQQEFMKSSRATYDQLKQAPVALESIDKAKALIPSAKGFMGPGGEGLLEASKFLNNRLGMNIDTKGVKDAEELRTRIFFNIMDNLKKMDAQPSQMQQQIMADALGKLGTDPNALPAVLDAFADSIKGKVGLYNQEVTSATQRGVKFPYDPVIKLPERKAEPQYPTATNAKGERVIYKDGKWQPEQ